MNSALSIAASGMNFASDMLAVTANNVANSLTDGFKAGRVTGREQVGGGVQGVVSQDARPGPTVADSEGLLRERSNVDLETEAVSTLMSLRAFEANAAVFRTARDMAGTVLDRMA